MKPHLPLLISIIICSCGNNRQTGQVKKVDSVQKTARSISAKTGNIITSSAVKKAYTLPDISGQYNELDDEDAVDSCSISVLIKKNQAGYTFDLTTPTRHRRGKVSLEKNTGNTLGITFEGIKYAEYEGDVSKLSDDDARPNLKLPIGIDGELEGDTITIQNYGNAMNYYVKITGCGVKYLRLVKVK